MKPEYALAGILAVLALGAVIYVNVPKGASMNIPESTPVVPSEPKPPVMEIDPEKQYTAVLRTTEGDITVELTAKETPKTVNNFVFLARKKFYDKTVFHRVIDGFMIQGGDPKGNGSGGPGYRFDDEPFTGEYLRGTVAMANAGPNTNGSQFFIMHKDYELSPSYVIFGRVTDGLDVVDKIATAPTVQDGRENSRPVTPVTVTSVQITER